MKRNFMQYIFTKVIITIRYTINIYFQTIESMNQLINEYIIMLIIYMFKTQINKLLVIQLMLLAKYA